GVRKRAGQAKYRHAGERHAATVLGRQDQGRESIVWRQGRQIGANMIYESAIPLYANGRPHYFRHFLRRGYYATNRATIVGPLETKTGAAKSAAISARAVTVLCRGCVGVLSRCLPTPLWNTATPRTVALRRLGSLPPLWGAARQPKPFRAPRQEGSSHTTYREA